MEIYDVLHEEHQYVLGLLEKLEKGRSDTKKDLLAEIALALTAHTKSEELNFYTPLKEVASAKDSIGEAFEEHHLTDILLGELSTLSVDDERFGAKARVLREMVSHHIEEEEGEIFAIARQTFDSAVAEGIANEFLATKQELLAGPSLLERGKETFQKLADVVSSAVRT